MAIWHGCLIGWRGHPGKQQSLPRGWHLVFREGNVVVREGGMASGLLRGQRGLQEDGVAFGLPRWWRGRPFFREVDVASGLMRGQRGILSSERFGLVL